MTERDTAYITLRDTTYINVPYAVHDTVTLTQKEYVTERDTAYITLRDTTYINVPYAVHDTVTLTQKEYVTERDTAYITLRDTTYVNVPYAVHDTTYITVYDTTYINVPYAVHDTTIVTDTVTLTHKEFVPVHDTSYVYINNTVTDTLTLTQKEYVPVHDTTYITVYDTTYINVPYAVHDTTFVVDTVTITQKEVVPVHDTSYVYINNTVTDTLTLTQKEYVPVHDTTYITVYDTTYINVPYAVHDTTFVVDTVTITQKEVVPVHDTSYVYINNTVTDTLTLTQKEYVTVRDTTILRDTVTLKEYVPVHDTSYVYINNTVTDTLTLTQKEYVPVHDTAYITLRDTTILRDTVTLKEYVTKRDTAYITLRDTTILRDTVTLKEYVTVHDTSYITLHDTTVVYDTVVFASTPTSDLALASTSAVAMTGYTPASGSASAPSQEAAPQRKVGKKLKVALMMPLHLDQMEQISTSKFDVEQRGKRTYRQFEFIEFYEGVLLALDRLAEQGVNVELNVVDVSDNSAAKVEEAFASHHVDRSDVVVALLLRDAFDKAAELAQQAGIYIVNPMSTRSELCAENPYMVKVQPSLAGQIALMLDNMKLERPDGHLYIIHSNAKAEKAAMDELKRQLTERGDIKYTIFNWSQSAKLATVLKATPSCNVVSIYDQGRDNNRVYTINLLNRLSSIKKNSPVLYSFTDWTREYSDIDFNQLQLLNYHTFSQNWDMTNDVHVQFLQSFRTRYGAEPTTSLAATAHDLILYVVGGLAKRNSGFWQQPGPSLPTLIQPLHLVRQGAGLENDRAQLYRMEGMRFVKAQYK